MNLAELRNYRSPILSLMESYGAQNVRVFGSVARNEATPNSDIDLLVSLRPGVSLFDIVSMQFAIEALLKQKVDILSEKGISPYIRDDVLKEAIPL